MTYLHDKSIAKHLHAAPTIILVKPQLGENIGSVARVMLNFGVTELRIVSPRDGWPNVKACSTASGAGSLLDKATVFESVADACADLNFVFSTTARNRGLTKNVKPPEVAMQEALDILNEQTIKLDTMRLRSFPFNLSVWEFIEDHDLLFIVEQNRDGQMRTLLMAEGGIIPDKLVSVLSFDGQPITADFISNKIKAHILGDPVKLASSGD